MPTHGKVISSFLQFLRGECTRTECLFLRKIGTGRYDQGHRHDGGLDAFLGLTEWQLPTQSGRCVVGLCNSVEPPIEGVVLLALAPVFEPAAIETARRRFRLSTPAELPSRAALPQAPLLSRWSAARRTIPRPLPSRPPQPCRRDGLCQTSSRHHVGCALV